MVINADTNTIDIIDNIPLGNIPEEDKYGGTSTDMVSDLPLRCNS